MLQEGKVLQELIMEATDAFKIHYDGRKDDPYCYRWTIYTGILAADCKVGDKVVVQDGDNLYSTVQLSDGKEVALRIWGIEEFNKSFQEGKKGQNIGLVFRKSALPKANVKIYKAE